MHRTLLFGPRAAPETQASTGEHRDLESWLQSGRLTLVARGRGPLPPEDWPGLPAPVRERALEEFERIVRGNTKAAVIFLAEG